jgi:hypothetical protein
MGAGGILYSVFSNEKMILMGPKSALVVVRNIGVTGCLPRAFKNYCEHIGYTSTADGNYKYL